MEVVFVLKTPEKSAAECILCAPLARNRVAAEAGQGERGTHQNVVGPLYAGAAPGPAGPPHGAIRTVPTGQGGWTTECASATSGREPTIRTVAPAGPRRGAISVTVGTACAHGTGLRRCPRWAPHVPTGQGSHGASRDRGAKPKSPL